MSRILFFLVALIAVVLAVLVFAPGVVPVAAYKSRIETAASNAVGREVTIGDNLQLRLLPHTGFHVEDLEIANAEGFDGDYLVRVDEANIGVRIMSLLQGAVEVSRFDLTQPDIILERAANGDVNWNLASVSTTDAQDGEAQTNEARDVNLGVMRIINGKASYSDAVADKSYVAEAINMTVTLNSLSEPLEANGTMQFQNEPTNVDIVLTSLSQLMANDTSNLKIDLNIGDAVVGADLAITPGDTLGYAGPVRVEAPNLPAFAALLGLDLADAPGFDSLSLAGDVDGDPSSLRLSNTTLAFDEINAQGVFNFDWSGARPMASGIFSTDRLDLRRYLPPPAENAGGFPAWSNAPIDFASLRNVDADFDISTDAIFLNDLEFGQSRLKLIVSNGRMTADIPELAMYGGQGSGRVVVNARSAVPSFSGNFDMGSVQAQPFSLDLLKHDNLLGLGSFKFNFTASGASQADIMSSMNGAGGFDLANGALKGVNIAKFARAANSLRQGVDVNALQAALVEARGPDQQTDFSSFLSDFQITNGLANTGNIQLSGPYFTMSGNGNVNLALQTIDLRLQPRANDREDGTGEFTATLPVRVGGTFAQPTFAIDAEALLLDRAPSPVRDVLDAVRNLSGDNTSTGGQQETTPEDAALGLLEGLFSEPQEEEDGESDQ